MNQDEIQQLVNDAVQAAIASGRISAGGAVFTGQGLPPEYIDGAKDGDWWLDTNTRLLYRYSVNGEDSGFYTPGWSGGNGAPVAPGEIGDLYIDLTNAMVYAYSATGWSQVGTLDGAPVPGFPYSVDPTADTLVQRDSEGRTKVSTPVDSLDAANKGYVDQAVANSGGGGGGTLTPETSAAEPDTLVLRDASGRSKVATPAVAADIATKGYVDGALPTVSSSATAGTVPLRGTGGRITGVGAPTANADAATKAYVDSSTSNAVSKTHIVPTGLVGDGVADDTAALQAGIDLAVSSGVPLFIPSGTYRVTATLRVLGSGGRIKLSPKATIIRHHTGNMLANGAYKNTVGGFGDLVIEGGTWNANGLNFSPWGSIFVFGKASNITIKNMVCKNVADSHIVEWAGVADGTADGVRFGGYRDSDGTRNYAEAFQVERMTTAGFPEFNIGDNTPTTNLRIINCSQISPDAGYSRWPVAVGCHTTDTGGVRISGIDVRDCNFGECTFSVIALGAWDNTRLTRVTGDTKVVSAPVIRSRTTATARTVGLVITDCDLRNTGLVTGPFIQYADDIQVSGGYFYGGSNGLCFGGCQNVQVSGSRLGAGATDALVIESSSSNVTVTGCVLDAQSCSIALKTSASGVLVTGCSLMNRATSNSVFRVDASVGRVAAIGNIHAVGRTLVNSAATAFTQANNVGAL